MWLRLPTWRQPVRGAYRSVPTEQDPMLNFDERDLLR
jgi:hypothetical protein